MDEHTADQHRHPHTAGSGADVWWLVLAAVGLVGLAGLTVAIANHVVFGFDQPLLALGQSWDGWPDLWKAISETANIPLIVIGLGFVIWLFVTKRRREALVVLLMLIAVTAGSEGIKQLTQRPRPETGTAAGIPGVVYSYPSGHVLEAMTILSFVALRVWRTAAAFAVRIGVAVAVAIDVILVAIARVSLSAHYPTDVLAGFLGGLGVLGLYAWLTRRGAWADDDPDHGAVRATSTPEPRPSPATTPSRADRR
jgi:membrane-associated phospholipid phosphatase